MKEKEKKEQTHVIYVRDVGLTETGFASIEDTRAAFGRLSAAYPEPGHRVRKRFRSRTGLWDVLVKVRTEVKKETKGPPTRAEREADRDLAFIGQHALTGE